MNFFHLGLLTSISALSFSILSAQETDSFSSVQFVNATSVPSLELEVNGRVWHRKMPPARATSPGKFPFHVWKIQAGPSDAKTRLHVTPEISRGGSYVIVFVGDFEPVKEDEPNSIFKNSPKRAAAITLDNKLGASERMNRVRLVNADAEETIVATVDNQAPQHILPLQTITFSDIPAAANVKVTASSQTLDIPLLILPPSKGVTIAIFNDGKTFRAATVNEMILTAAGDFKNASEEEVQAIIESNQTIEE